MEPGTLDKTLSHQSNFPLFQNFVQFKLIWLPMSTWSFEWLTSWWGTSAPLMRVRFLYNNLIPLIRFCTRYYLLQWHLPLIHNFRFWIWHQHIILHTVYVAFSLDQFNFFFFQFFNTFFGYSINIFSLIFIWDMFNEFIFLMDLISIST